jgi:hypothetical protein
VVEPSGEFRRMDISRKQLYSSVLSICATFCDIGTYFHDEVVPLQKQEVLKTICFSVIHADVICFVLVVPRM